MLDGPGSLRKAVSSLADVPVVANEAGRTWFLLPESAALTGRQVGEAIRKMVGRIAVCHRDLDEVLDKIDTGRTL